MVSRGATNLQESHSSAIFTARGNCSRWRRPIRTRRNSTITYISLRKLRTIPKPCRSSSGVGGHLPLKAATHRSDFLRRRFSNSSRCGCSEGISPFSEQIPHSFWIADPPRTSFSYFIFRLPRRWNGVRRAFLHLMRVGRIITAEGAALVKPAVAIQELLRGSKWCLMQFLGTLYQAETPAKLAV